MFKAFYAFSKFFGLSGESAMKTGDRTMLGNVTLADWFTSTRNYKSNTNSGSKVK